MIDITTMVDCVVARSLAQRVAREAGFDARRACEVGIVAGELASNIVKHAFGSGRLSLRVGRGGLHLVARDRGPGMKEPGSLLEDRAARLIPGRGLVGLGCGGGALARLLDSVKITNRAQGGLRVHGLKRFGGRLGR